MMLGAVCHDLGKPPRRRSSTAASGRSATRRRGVAPATAFLDRLNVHTLDGVDVRAPGPRARRAPPASRACGTRCRRRRRRRVPAAGRRRWTSSCSRGSRSADCHGRTGAFDCSRDGLVPRARAALGVEHRPPAPLLLGRHLIALGVLPGPRLGEILARCLREAARRVVRPRSTKGSSWPVELIETMSMSVRGPGRLSRPTSSANRSGATLPPLTTATTCTRRASRARDSAAATLAAPLGSATMCEPARATPRPRRFPRRSRSPPRPRTPARARTSASPGRAGSRPSAMLDVASSVTGAPAVERSAHLRGAGGLDADDADRGLEALDRGGDARRAARRRPRARRSSATSGHSSRISRPTVPCPAMIHG